MTQICISWNNIEGRQNTLKSTYLESVSSTAGVLIFTIHCGKISMIKKHKNLNKWGFISPGDHHGDFRLKIEISAVLLKQQNFIQYQIIYLRLNSLERSMIKIGTSTNHLILIVHYLHIGKCINACLYFQKGKKKGHTWK